MFLLPLIACQPLEPADEAAAIVTEVVPTTVELGRLALGEPGVVVLSVYNRGDAEVHLSGVSSTSDAVTVDAELDLPIQPDALQEVTVTWSSATAAELDDAIHLRVANAEATAELVVPIRGSAVGAELSLSTEEVDLGTVIVGCEAETTVTMTNTGTAPLTVADVSLPDSSVVTLEGEGDQLGSFPWELAPEESRTVRLRYAPLDQVPLNTFLYVTSDDPWTPFGHVTVSGQGFIEEPNTILFDVERRPNVTALFALNRVVTRGQYSERLREFLPVFFDALLASQAYFRVAMLTWTTGITVGDTFYIDDTMTTEEAMAVVEGMIAESADDNDYLLETLANGIDQNSGWLLDGSDAWRESRLNLIGMNSDTEQSRGNATAYLLEYRTYKEDPDDIVVHGIGGDMPRGCGRAEPFEAFYDASLETGGVFLSICKRDWTRHMETLAAAVLGEPPSFVLTGEPAEWSIAVQIDGVPSTEGWSYDADLHEIVFASDHFPVPGAQLRVDYFMASECPA